MSLLLGVLLALFSGGAPILPEGEGDPGTEEVLLERSPQNSSTARQTEIPERVSPASRPSPARLDEGPLKSRLDSWIARRWFRTPS
jgi:hypothetical protein